MDYRDERDALRGRVDNLEQELGEARRELDARRGDDKRARIAQIERSMVEAQRLLAELGRELGELKGTPPRRTHMAPFVGVAVVLALAIGAGALLVVRRGPPAPLPQQRAPVPARAVTAAPQPPEAPKAPPAPLRRAHAVWAAKVTGRTGAAPPIGTPCTVEANLESEKGTVAVSNVAVSCGGVHLYRSTDELAGMSMLSAGAHERAGAEAGTWWYALAFDDKGTRSGARNEVSIDTAAGVGAAWRTSVPAFRVDLSIAHESAPVRGEPLAQ